ncbi:hypothetical protein ACGFYZ_28335 [Streptomyces sp. NPDC048330]|uniref:hypothetical protein n=1 Tax=Streptomyces sp. NPDC048330 TaxID=3365533 RepID=UPI00371B3DAB
MIESTTAAPPTTDSAALRAERRRLVESVRAHRRLLVARGPFELGDRRRLNREAGHRARVEARHGKSLQRIHEKRIRRERSLTGGMKGLDGKRESRERQALAVLRREAVERSLRGTRLTAGQVNGIGSGLVRDLAAQGITTAADFRRVSWGTAPGGRGGEVLYIHRTQGRKVHVNGIGEHRGRPLMEWRKAAVARAEARAPHELPADERHRIEEIVQAERIRLEAELARVPAEAESARAEAEQIRAGRLSELAGVAREARSEAERRRAGFDETAERLLALRAELSAHVDLYGDLGLRDRRARSRALRPVPPFAPPVPAPRRPAETAAPRQANDGAAAGRSAAAGVVARPEAASGAGSERDGSTGPRGPVGDGGAEGGVAGPGVPGVRAGLGWLVPVALFGLTAVLGAGETGATPLWFSVAARLVALVVVVDLLRLWIPRRNRRTAGAMPAGTGPVASGAFLGLVAAGMFVDPEHTAGGAPWAVSVVAVSLVVVGTGRRAGRATAAQAAD